MARTDTLDIGRMRLQSGEGRRMEVEVDLGSFCFAGTPYSVTPHSAPVVLDINRMTHGGYALRVRIERAAWLRRTSTLVVEAQHTRVVLADLPDNELQHRHALKGAKTRFGQAASV